MQRWWSNSAKKKNLIGKIKSCQECKHPCQLKKKKKWGKVMPGDAVTPNAGPRLLLLLNC